MLAAFGGYLWFLDVGGGEFPMFDHPSVVLARKRDRLQQWCLVTNASRYWWKCTAIGRVWNMVQ